MSKSVWRVGFHVKVLDLSGRATGTLSGVEGGSFTFQNSDTVKASGSITVTGDAGVDWLGIRLQPVHVINGTEYPLGVFIPSVPSGRHTATTQTAEVQLMDLLAALDTTKLDATMTIPQGTNVMAAVAGVFALAGTTRYSLPESGAVTRTDQTWAPATPALRVINDILGAAGFNSLFTDTNGVYTTTPYVLPEGRPVVYQLHDDEFSIVSPEFDVTEDLYQVLNKVTLISSATETVPALMATVTNENPESRFSFQRRGFWVSDVADGVETTSQSALNAEAAKRLAESADVALSVTLRHAAIPVKLMDAVAFRNLRAGYDFTAVCTNLQVPLNPLELMTGTYRKVNTQ